MRDFALSYFTVPELGPVEMIDVAASTGYSYVSLRPVRPRPGAPAQDLLDNPILLRQLTERSSATGIGILDLEFLWITEDFDPNGYEALGALGAQLGAKAILAGGNDPDRARLSDCYATLCEAMAPYGLRVSLECVSYSAVNSLPIARQVIDTAGRPENAGILIDALHYARRDDTLQDVAALPAEWIHSAQLCDAHCHLSDTHDQILATALRERVPLGEGNIDVRGLVAHLPAGIPLSLEVPNPDRCTKVGEREWAAQNIAAARGLLGA